MSAQPVIAWFRLDLRLSDNPALTAAAATCSPVLPVYVLDEESPGPFAMGSASRWWLHQSLAALNESLDGTLHVVRGDAATVIPALANQIAAAGVFWNRGYEPWRVERDRRIKSTLRETGVAAESFGGYLLFEPQSVTKPDGTPYRVFTPYYRKGCLGNSPEPRQPLPVPTFETWTDAPEPDGLDALGLVPDIDWYRGMADAWTPGERGAAERLDAFLSEGIRNYKEGRNRPDLCHVSRLSPHLHFGEISPNQAWHGAAASGAAAADIDCFRSELGWREFSHYLLYHFPELPEKNLQKKFDGFPWQDHPEWLERWQRGLTGYPIVDAGMRELWETGYMHNRVRMIVGSFLVKNLLVHWHHGRDWFWDTLVDADLGNNSASWQWIAGCGADAAPYFRIFNPVTQGSKFDPDGDYVRRYVPELAALPTQYLHEPWSAPPSVLSAAGIRLDEDYPAPIVDLGDSRVRALEAFQGLRRSAA